MIGEYFHGISLLSLEQVEEIVKHQEEHPDLKFGEIAVKLGYLTQADIDGYLQDHAT